jgi:CubicO group peptidase (beta-lactamase class C family)
MTLSPESAGLDSRHLSGIGVAVPNGRLWNLHGLVVMRSGHLVFEQYFTGHDERLGMPLGQVAFGPDTLHDVRSVTKSVVSLLYGIALEDGHAPPLECPLLEAVPGYPDLERDPARMRIRVKHALTMTLGAEWNEGIPYSDPRNDERRMAAAADRYRFVLDRPLTTPARRGLELQWRRHRRHRGPGGARHGPAPARLREGAPLRSARHRAPRLDERQRP